MPKTIANDLNILRKIDEIIFRDGNQAEVKIEKGRVVVIEISRKVKYKETDNAQRG